MMVTDPEVRYGTVPDRLTSLQLGTARRHGHTRGVIVFLPGLTYRIVGS